MSNPTELEELRREKLAYLEKAHILETRSDEKFRLEYEIKELRRELTRLDNAPRSLTRYVPSYNPGQMIGRRDLLRTIHAHLTNGNQVVLVNGIGGIGKTTVAQAYINLPEYAACYHHIAWVSVFGSIRDDMLRELETDATGFKYQPNEDPAANFQRLIDCLQRISGVNLLILDNANQADDLIAVKKQIHALRWKTLFTSRAALPQGVYPTIPVDTLSPDDAAALFRRFYRKPIDENLLTHLLTKIEYHTLLTELLAKAGNENPALNLQQLGDLLDAQGITAEPLQAEIFTDHQLSRQDEATLITLGGYLLKIFDAANLSDAEQTYLRYFSILPSTAEDYTDLVDYFQIGKKQNRFNLKSFLKKMFFKKNVSELTPEEEQTQFPNTLLALVRKGWLTKDEQGRFKMHPVIQAVMREKLRPDARNCAILIDTFIWKLRVNSGDNYLDRVKYVPYGEQIVWWIRKNDADIATLTGNLAGVIEAVGHYQKALEYELKALVIREQVLAPNHPYLANSYNNIGNTYRQLGDFNVALQYHRKAIPIFKKQFHSYHPELAKFYNNIGMTYQGLGDLNNALKYYLKSLAIRELMFDHNDPELAKSYNSLGCIYGKLGNFDAALQYHLKAIDIREQVLDPNHPDLANSYCNIGDIYRLLRDFDNALQYQEKAISIRKRVLATNHPLLANSYSNIGLTYDDLGDYENALHYYIEEIGILEKVLPANHPNLANSYNNIAVTYYYLKDYDTAKEYIDKAVSIYQRALPPEHPDLKNALGWQKDITDALTASRGG